MGAGVDAIAVEAAQLVGVTPQPFIDQPFVKEESKLVGELLKIAGLKLVKFVRYKVGEKS